MVQIIHKGQHLLRHKSQEVGYTNVSQPGIVTVKGAIDDIYTSLSSVLSWQAPVATPADLPLTGNTINDARVVQDDGDGGAAIYVCIATTGTLSDQWQKIADVDWGGSTVYTDTTFYVDGSTGSNSNTGEDWANALANLDFLYSEDANAIPRELQANITIYVRNNIYSTGTTHHTKIDRFYGFGTINIIGEITDILTGISVTGQDNVVGSITQGSYLDASAAGLTINAHVGDFILITAGTGVGTEKYPILSNTATRIETYNLPTLDGTSVFKIVRGTKFINATVAAPSTPISYSDTNAMQIWYNYNKSITLEGINFTESGDSNKMGLSIYGCSSQIGLNYTTHTANVMANYTETFYSTSCLFLSENWNWTGCLFVEEASYTNCIISSVSSDSYGLYTEYSTVIARTCRFENTLCGIIATGEGTLRLIGNTLFKDTGCAIKPIKGKMIINSFTANTYISFINCTNGVSCGSGEFLIGKTTTFQGTGVTNEVVLGLTDIRSFADLNANNPIANAVTGGFVTYYDEASYIPVFIDEYNNSTSQLNAVNYQGAIDEINVTADSISNADSPYTASTDSIILVDTSAGGVTVDLPASASSVNKKYTIKKITSDTNQITVDPNASETIDGSTTKVIGQFNASMSIICDGSNWHII